MLQTLQARFEKHMRRHTGLVWSDVLAKLEDNAGALEVLRNMEATGGEPDVVDYNAANGTYTWCDCSVESPAGRRSVCYDREGLESRKEHKPKTSAVELADELGISLLTEPQYRHLQTLGEFDTKTSSWIVTPPEIRVLGGALFGDRRYGQVFVYHNGAQSYYGARGFRGVLHV